MLSEVAKMVVSDRFDPDKFDLENVYQRDDSVDDMSRTFKFNQ